MQFIDDIHCRGGLKTRPYNTSARKTEICAMEEDENIYILSSKGGQKHIPGGGIQKM